MIGNRWGIEGSCLLAVCLVAALAGPPARAGEPEGADASFGVPVHRPLLCVRTMKMKGEMALQGRAAGQKVPMASEETLTFVDEHSRNEAAEEESTRTFLSARALMNGQVDDPPLAGVVAGFTSKDQKVQLRLKGNRRLTQKRLNDLLRTSGSTGIWLDLPRKATVGAQYEVNLMILAPVMLTGDLPVESAVAKLKLEGVDESTRTLSFQGPAKLVERGEIEGMKSHATYDVTCDLKVRPGETRILSLKLDGTFEAEVSGEIEAAIKGTFSSELVTEIGEPVAKALKEKPVFRQRPWELGKFGLRVTLPASWDRAPAEEKSQSFIGTLNSDKGCPVITIARFAGDPSAQKVYFDALTAEHRKQFPALKVSKVTSGIGAGQAYDRSSSEKGEETKMRLEYYPLGKFVVLYKLAGPPKAFPLALPEFEKARSTLKALR